MVAKKVGPGKWCVIVFALGALPCLALGGPIENVIEIDGNCTDEAGGGLDFGAVADGSAAGDPRIIVSSGLVMDPAPLTIFTGGGSKDDLDIPNWQWKDGSVPAKDNFTNGIAVLMEDPVTHHRILAVAGDRYANNGDAQIGFWVFHNPVGLNPDGTFSGQHTPGDLLVLAHFLQGGAVADLELYEWQADGSLLFVADLTMSGEIVAATNAIEVPTCWAYEPKFAPDNPGYYPTVSYFEGAADLTALNVGGGCFSSFLGETRSSQSIDAVLKDFILGGFDTCSDISGTKLEVEDDGTCETVVGPLAGWEIRLLDTNGSLVTQDGDGNPLANPVCTDTSGFYSFANVPNGEEYTVCEVVPDRQPGENFNWQPCFPDSGVVGGPVSPGACPTGSGDEYCHPAFTLETDVQKDFRNYKSTIYCDMTTLKFCDEDGDGTLDAPGDYLLGGFCICVEPLDGSPGPDTTMCGTTGPAGDFTIPVATGFSYRITEDLTGGACESGNMSAGWLETTPQQQEVFVPPASGQPGEAPCPEVHVGNTSIPTIDCGSADVTIFNETGVCEAEHCFTPTAANECGDVNITCTATGPDGQIPLVPGDEPGELCGNFPAACPAVTTVTCTATTEATANIPGATDECSFTVTVTDNEDPAIQNVPGPETVECDGDVPAPATDVTCLDNCDGTYPAEYLGQTDDGQTCPRTITRTWRCTDACNNSVEDTQTIIVDDTTDPAIQNVPGPETAQCDGDVPPPATDVTCLDNCDGTYPAEYLGQTDDGQTCPRTITRTWRCTDACSNSVEDTQTIIVDDTTAPTVYCNQGNETIQCNVALCFTPTAEDNCDLDPDISCQVVESSDPTRVEFDPVGLCVTLTATASATIECTATDDCGNASAPCSFTVDATCNQACSPGFWRNHNDAWCLTPFNPVEDWCFDGPATMFLEAFEIDCTVPGACSAVPNAFIVSPPTLLEAVSTSGGSFNQTLFHGSAALLSSYAVSFPVGPEAVRDVMQDAFDGTITFSAAHQIFATWNATESEGGCPLN